MSLRRMIWCIAIITALACVQAAPNNQSKDSAHDNESESVSHEAESKEISDESIEADSEYQDKDSKPDKAYQISRYYISLLRPIPLPETYGIPAEGNPDMIPLSQVLAESEAEYYKYNHGGRTEQDIYDK